MPDSIGVPDSIYLLVFGFGFVSMPQLLLCIITTTNLYTCIYMFILTLRSILLSGVIAQTLSHTDETLVSQRTGGSVFTHGVGRYWSIN